MSGAIQKTNGEFSIFNTGISGLDLMLGGEGIRFKQNGSFFGVVYGTSGSGKSILGLQICCQCSFQTDPQTAPEKLLKVVYITHEPADVVWSRLKEFKQFKSELEHEGRKVFTQDNRNEEERSKWLTAPGVHIVTLPLDVSEQVDVLMNVVDLAAKNRDKDKLPEWLIVFDNAESISPEAFNNAFDLDKSKDFNPDYSPRDGIFFKKIRNRFIERKVSAFFFFEEPEDWKDESTSVEVAKSAQAYAADVVIHLSRHSEHGYRQRTIEVVKARNQFHLRGRHHFSIVGEQNQDSKTPDHKKQIGVSIYPSLAAKTHELRLNTTNETQKAASDNPDFGSDALNVVLQLGSEKPAEHIHQGSSNVLVSDIDDRATSLAMHFALAGVNPIDKTPECKSLYISFQKNENDLCEVAKKFWGEEAKKLVSINTEAACRVLYLTPDLISESKLLMDIENALEFNDKSKLPRPRVVIDNIFGIKSRFPLLQNPEFFFAALFARLKEKQVTVFVVESVEAGERANPVEKSMLAGMTDNVFVLRHVVFPSNTRSVFSILKVSGNTTPEKYWELTEKNDTGNKKTRLEAVDTFEFYRDVLSGDPKPVQITMSFYSEAKGTPLNRYLEAQKNTFERTFGKTIKVELFWPDEYARMQRNLEIASALPQSDCHIVSIDEFWLEHLVRNSLLENLFPSFKKLQEEFNAEKRQPSETVSRKDFVGCAHDCAIFLNHERIGEPLVNKRFAIAVRSNCGLMCCDRRKLLRSFENVSFAGGNLAFKQWIETGKASKDINWKSVIKFKQEYDSIKAVFAPVAEERPEVFFTFSMEHLESCVCFLLELALASQEKRGDIFGCLVENRKKLKIDKFHQALVWMLELIDNKDLELLAAGRFRTNSNEPKALFSRQWWSTLGCLRNRGWGDATNQKIKRVSCSDHYFRYLEALELPCGNDGEPKTISGNWYLGILKGSVAVKAGVRVIRQFCTRSDDEYKMRNFIGMPARTEFYNENNPYCLPYAKQFKELADNKDKPGDGKDFKDDEAPKLTRKYSELGYALNVECPFSRMGIWQYDKVAPILYRMMIVAAQEALAHIRFDMGEDERKICLEQCATKAIEVGENQFNLLT
jgi:KaiC/GvpD/RAD55 family RecA-like ATPase